LLIKNKKNSDTVKMNLKKKINGGIVDSYEDLNKWLENNNNKEGLIIEKFTNKEDDKILLVSHNTLFGNFHKEKISLLCWIQHIN